MQRPRFARQQNGVFLREEEYYLSLLLSSLPAANFTAFEALIFIFSLVFGFTPRRALRLTTLKVPNPISWKLCPFRRAAAIESMTAATDFSAPALLVSLPRAF